MDSAQNPVVRALIVDDHADALTTSHRLLTLLNCEARTCDAGQRCLEIAAEFRPQLVLLDLAMPGMDGFELAKGLKAAHLPPFLLVAITGYDAEELRARSRVAGFDDFVVKPATLEKLQSLTDAARRLAGA